MVSLLLSGGVALFDQDGYDFFIKRKFDHVRDVLKKGASETGRYRPVTTKELIASLGCLLALSYGVMDTTAEEWGVPSGDDLVQPLNMHARSGISLNRFNAISKMITATKAPSTEHEKNDRHYDYRPLVDGFNDHYDAHFYPSWGVCIDESMFHWFGQGLPHMSFLPRKPKALGTEMKTLCDYACGLLFRMEIQESKGAMEGLLKTAKEKFGSGVTKTTASVMRLTEKLHRQTGPSGRRRVVIRDSWFASVATAKALNGVGLFFVGPEKTNTKNFPMQLLSTLVAEERGSSACVHAVIVGVALLPVAWRRRKAFKKRGKAGE